MLNPAFTKRTKTFPVTPVAGEAGNGGSPGSRPMTAPWGHRELSPQL